jgi:hypothetical protein
MAMPNSNQSAQTADDRVLIDEKPPCMALVPVVPALRWSRVPDQMTSRADFVTQLIATAEHAPQTRSLRRATPADAQAAYGANRRPAFAAGIRTRQTI